MSLTDQQIALQIAEKLREIATRQGNVPFDRGDLRKSHITEPWGADGAILSANMPYARAVHDGRPALTIKPKRKKALKFKGKNGPAFARAVHQPARKGNPWLARAVATLETEGLDFLAPRIGQEMTDRLNKGLRSRGLHVNPKP
ncbi:MAG: hypothetical protein Q4G25_12755 [Paracoccus sp. (in: a-proteobacteria)]|nr:hypothetical protein [Paracoccus sp. (in: a-proteobacteria)]